MFDSCVCHGPVQSATQKTLVKGTETACAVTTAVMMLLPLSGALPQQTALSQFTLPIRIPLRLPCHCRAVI